jgi:hypothetical protein
MRARSVVVVSLFVAVAAPAACHSGNGSGCPTSSCKISALTYQTCQSSDGTVTYSFAGQSCSCPPSEAEQCSECDGNLQLYCEGVSGDGGGDSGEDSGSSSGGQGDDSGGSSGGGSGGGSGSGSGGVMDSGEAPCVLGVSGAINASMTCEVTLTYTTLTKRADLTISVPQPMPLQAVSIEIGQPGEPMTGTWTGADTGATASISAVDSINSMNESWACQVSGGTSVGEYTLDLTVGKGQITSSGESFGANGTLTATLLPQSGTDAMGDVKVQVSF